MVNYILCIRNNCINVKSYVVSLEILEKLVENIKMVVLLDVTEIIHPNSDYKIREDKFLTAIMTSKSLIPEKGIFYIKDQTEEKIQIIENIIFNRSTETSEEHEPKKILE